MGHPRLSLRVKNTTKFLFALDVTKSVFRKYIQKLSKNLFFYFFLHLVMFFMQLQGECNRRQQLFDKLKIWYRLNLIFLLYISDCFWYLLFFFKKTGLENNPYRAEYRYDAYAVLENVALP